MNNYATALINAPLLALLQRQPPPPCQVAPLYLVGGAIREALLDRPIFDLDFTSPHDLTACAQALAQHCGGHWFWLDQSRRQSRVMVGSVTCDFVPWRGPTLAADLALRDFTFNALALDLSIPLSKAPLIDPLNGANDLDRRILKIASAGVLEDDPLRILKGLRHVAQLDLEIEPSSLAAMQTAAPKLSTVAPERLRSELWQILSAPSASRALDELLNCGAGTVLFGPTFASSIPFAHSALERSRGLFEYLTALEPQVGVWLAESVEQRLDRATLLTFSTVLHAIDAALPLRLARNWRFGRLAIARLAALDNIRTALWSELVRLPKHPRAVAQWALQYSPEPVDLLLGLALQLDVSVEEISLQLHPYLSALSNLGDMRHIPTLVDGNWLTKELGLSGEMIGLALSALKRAEIYAGITGIEDAKSFLYREFGKKS